MGSDIQFNAQFRVFLRSIRLSNKYRLMAIWLVYLCLNFAANPPPVQKNPLKLLSFMNGQITLKMFHSFGP